MNNKYTKILILVFAIFCFEQIMAKNVEKSVAKQVALNFYVEHSIIPITAKSISITEEFELSEQSKTVGYIFNFSNNGFVIVSADDAVRPVPGYSYDGKYNSDDQSPQFLYWLGTYKKQIAQAINSNYTAPAEISGEWQRLSAKTENFSPEKGDKVMAPFLTSTWNQGSCYNALCPVDASGPGGRCWAGCVAVAMSQVMYYYRYPAQGLGSNSYNCSPYGTLSANFGSATYNYNAMTSECTNGNAAIATLMYHAGVSVDMNYAPDGSGAHMWDAANSLVSHFKYSSSIQNDAKNYFTDAQWDLKLRTELDNKRPIIYSGSDPDTWSGHAWVCDGYQGNDYFHFDWGWSGAGNGYYYLNALTPMGNVFTDGQEAIYNIYPASGYPYFCSGTKTLTSSIGTFEDGSGSSDYQNNADCNWLVAPTGATHLTLSFVTLNTESTNDKVTIYDGPNASYPVLGQYSGSTLPGDIVSSGPSVFVNFKTNASVKNSGWQIYYYSAFPVYCSGVETLTAASDTFSDGSGMNSYNNNSNCKWLIQPPNAGTVTLHFNSFNTEATNDKVKITDPVTSNLLATYSGTSAPPNITSYSGQMLVIFQTNASVTSAGWAASYTSTPLGIDDYSSVKHFTLFPNPVNDVLHVSFDAADEKKVKLELIDITGQLVLSEELQGNGTFSESIKMASFSRGVYNLRIVTSGDIINKKVVIE